MPRMLPLLLAGVLAGCTATKSTVYLVQAEQSLLLAREANAEELAPYSWTLAEQFMLKAREEWAAADYGSAESLSMRVIELSEKAAQQARTNPQPALTPETAHPQKVLPPANPSEPWPEGNVNEGAGPTGGGR